MSMPGSVSPPQLHEDTLSEAYDEGEYASSEEEVIRRPTKRSKPKSRAAPIARANTAAGGAKDPLPKRRRSRGILQKMNDTPLDVLFEVCVSVSGSLLIE